MNLTQQARIACDVSQREFARLLGTRQCVVSRWEAGSVIPSASVRVLLRLIVEHPESVPEWLAERAADVATTWCDRDRPDRQDD